MQQQRRHQPRIERRLAHIAAIAPRDLLQIKALADQPNDQSAQVVPRHIVLHARWQKLNFVNLPGAKLLAHRPTQNQTSRRIQTQFSDRLLGQQRGDAHHWPHLPGQGDFRRYRPQCSHPQSGAGSRAASRWPWIGDSDGGLEPPLEGVLIENNQDGIIAPGLAGSELRIERSTFRSNGAMPGSTPSAAVCAPAGGSGPERRYGRCTALATRRWPPEARFGLGLSRRLHLRGTLAPAVGQGRGRRDPGLADAGAGAAAARRNAAEALTARANR